MSERFTEILRAASEPAWSDAVRHRFVNELFAGAVPDAVMARYLIQDHRFLDSFLTLLGATLASADTFEARVRSRGFEVFGELAEIGRVVLVAARALDGRAASLLGWRLAAERGARARHHALHRPDQ